MFHRKESIQHHSFGAKSPLKQTQRSRFARSTWTVAAVNKRDTIQAATEVSSDEDADEGFDMMLGTSTPEYIAMGLFGIFTGFVATGVSLLIEGHPCSTASIQKLISLAFIYTGTLPLRME